MEYCDGGSLDEYVEALQGAAIEEGVLRDLFRSTAIALVFLEGKHIVHRKVEPSSVLVSTARTFVSLSTLQIFLRAL